MVDTVRFDLVLGEGGLSMGTNRKGGDKVELVEVVARGRGWGRTRMLVRGVVACSSSGAETVRVRAED